MMYRFFLLFIHFIVAIPLISYGDNSETAHKESIVYQTKKFEESLERANAFLEDSTLNLFLASIINKLSDNDSSNASLLRVRILKSSTFNAFAAPHGTIYLCTGLLARLKNETQLAALLGHEMTHIVNNHSYQNLVNAKKKSLSSANLQFGLELFIGSAASAISNVTLKSAITGYTRDLEREADSAGLARMRNNGYQTTGFLNLFTILKTHVERYDIKEPYFFATHPAIEERISNYYTLTGLSPVTETYVEDEDREFDGILKPVLLVDGTMKIAAGDLSTAEENFSRILKADSSCSDALCNLGTITRLRSGNVLSEHVVKWYHRSMSFNSNPFSSQACCELGMYYYKSGIADSASFYLEAFQKNSPGSPFIPLIKDYLKKCLK
ncbi:MAG: M48 family metallopeptidase [Chitinispirillaceae bacterium]|nr:M48 family metallopeptidase [Chitinispirillaceae bacterium]